MMGPRLVVRIISRDTASTESLIENCNGSHVLIHDAYSQKTYKKVSLPQTQDG
jgi:hypothetical protein